MRTGGRPLTRRDGFDFIFSGGRLPFAVFFKGGRSGVHIRMNTGVGAIIQTLTQSSKRK
jgi:hypothetical protein